MRGDVLGVNNRDGQHREGINREVAKNAKGIDHEDAKGTKDYVASSRRRIFQPIRIMPIPNALRTPQHWATIQRFG